MYYIYLRGHSKSTFLEEWGLLKSEQKRTGGGGGGPGMCVRSLRTYWVFQNEVL